MRTFVKLQLAFSLLLICAGGPAAADQLSFARTDSILVVSPHPDDEVLCCAGMLARARAAGARVAVAWVTGGDAFELDARLIERKLRPGRGGLLQLGMRRAEEALEAAAVL